MLASMFGMGGSELIFILILALLFLGPEKLPQAARTLSKGIRDLKKQSRLLTQQIENHEQIGGALRDIKSALRGEEEPPRRVIKKKKPVLVPDTETPEGTLAKADAAGVPENQGVKLPQVAGEADPELPARHTTDDAHELAAMIKPAAGVVAQGEASVPPPTSEPDRSPDKHG
jgi:Tat protein translocase TatB subunit